MIAGLCALALLVVCAVSVPPPWDNTLAVEVHHKPKPGSPFRAARLRFAYMIFVKRPACVNFALLARFVHAVLKSKIWIIFSTSSCVRLKMRLPSSTN